MEKIIIERFTFHCPHCGKTGAVKEQENINE